MPPSEEAPETPAAWLLGRALDWQVTAAELALAVPLLAWRTGLALAGGWMEPMTPPDAAPVEPAEVPMAEEVDDLA